MAFTGPYRDLNSKRLDKSQYARWVTLPILLTDVNFALAWNVKSTFSRRTLEVIWLRRRKVATGRIVGKAANNR